KAAPKQLAADVLVDQIVGGLAIRKGIVEAHGGRIRAQSDGPGRGSRFTFTVSVAEEASRHVSPAGPVRSSKTEAERVRVLAVDDDPQLLPYIRDALTEAGYQPIATGDPEEALRLILKEKPQLALLDLMLPGTDGIELMKKIQDTAEVPVIFLSAYGQDQTIAQAIDAGADDYIVKPFSPTELAARIRAALRKRETPEPTEPYTLGELTIDYTQRSVTLAGRPVPLTAIEYRTLVELPTNPGRVLTYQHLLLRVWGHEHANDLRPMRTAISSLRRKLQDNSNNPTYIHTEHRVGYRMPHGDPQGQKRQPATP
ncbi:MAG: response regulator, partial [Actinomycetia bacterium]|nr:response regulator [Actinomycetes bacterium]